MRTRFLTFLSAALLLATACNKDRDKDFVTATVRDTGDFSENGCGFLLDVDGVGEKRPDYLMSAFQENGLKVKIKYHETGVLDTCGNKPPYQTYRLIAIDDIRRDL